MKFVKVNFDGNVRGASGSTGYVIQDVDGRLLAARGFFLFEPSISKAKLRVAGDWRGFSLREIPPSSLARCRIG